MVKGCLGGLQKTFTGETVPFSFTLENAEGAYTFDFPEVQISGDWPDAGALTLFRFSWISPRPILRQLSPAFPKCRRRQSVLRQPLQLEQWDLL